MLDMVHPTTEGKITLSDLKRCKLTPIFFDTFFNLEKYLDHEQRDPFATQRDSDSEMSEWDRFAAEEYELLVAEEGGSDAQDQISYDETDEDCLSPNIDDITNTDVVDESSVEELPASEAGAGAAAAAAAGYVNLSSIYTIGAADRWTNQIQNSSKDCLPDRKLPEKPVPPEKPVSLMMVNGKTDNRYAGFGGNNSFLYSHLLGGSGSTRAKDPPPYSTSAGGALFNKPDTAKSATSPNNASSNPVVTSPVNGVNKISDNYERAVAERLSPHRESARANRSSVFSRVHTGVVAGAAGAGAGATAAASRTRSPPDDDDDYARDSDECSI
ncbi:hypothetical protein MSG28_000512 [Choristoneura fumiferana]|uniref:Uncharacterized protein n=2 Tax=Choristoneura fumiferana TaxID=7141 RepID=A0ACC0K0U7_CHOFU|nr:hypothetical protein MSG28_000512 [Choristoneura fumiferana]